MAEATPLSCRSCGAPHMQPFVDLGMSPISNALRQASQQHEREYFYPLRTYVCGECKLVQCLDVNDREEHFHDAYSYFSSYSSSWLQHAKQYVDMMMKRLDLGATSQVVEVASNDGYLLRYFKDHGVPVLGVDPAANCAEAAWRDHGIETLVAFFGLQTATDLSSSRGKADLIVCNNVLAHVPDINDFVSGLKVLLGKGGVITIEFPHLLSLMDNLYFDTIYHEHYSYLSLLSVERLLARHSLTLFDVEELPTHGGSLRIFAAHADEAAEASERLRAFRAREAIAGLDDLATYASFSDKVARCKRLLLNLLHDLKEQGKTIVGYGAPAKASTLLNYCGIRQDVIDYTTDRSPHKQGRFLPGVGIPIRAPEAIFETKPDFVLIFPWNLQQEIVESMSDIRTWGGRFIVPLPNPTILP